MITRQRGTPDWARDEVPGGPARRRRVEELRIDSGNPHVVAVPVGDGPPGRGGFAIYPDEVVRVRADGNAPLLIDPPLVGHK